MAERHTIVVHVRAGEVKHVAFCDCCDAVTVEVRTYEADTPTTANAPNLGEPAMPRRLEDGRWQDHFGIFRIGYYEPAGG